MRKFIAILFIFFTFIFTENLCAYELGEQAGQNQDYRVGIGNLLYVEVYDEDDLTKEVRVLTDGYISFPLLGSVKAAGLSVGELEESIRSALAAKYLVNPQVSVLVREFSNVYVFGEVIEPGALPLYGKMTVFEAITRAGGFTEIANPSKVKIVRQQNNQEVTLVTDINKLTKNGDTSEDIELQENDRIIVSRGFF